MHFVSDFCICSQDKLMTEFSVALLKVNFYWLTAAGLNPQNLNFSPKAGFKLSTACDSIYLPDKDKLRLCWRMIPSLDFTSHLTGKHFTNITFRRQVNLINGFPTGGLFACSVGNRTGPIVLQSCYKTAASEGKAECVQIETWYHLKPWQRGKGNAVEQGSRCVQTGPPSLSDFCLYCPQLTGCWIASFEEGSGVTVCVFCVCLHLPFSSTSECEVKGDSSEPAGLILLCALLGSEVISWFFLFFF